MRRTLLAVVLVACAQPPEPPPAELARDEPAPRADPQPADPPQAENPVPPPGLNEPAPASSPACRTDWDCVLVTGGCAGPAAASLADAQALDARNQRQLSVAGCPGQLDPPVRPLCAGTCRAHPLDHPEWRACEDDGDCVLEWRGCSHYESVNRRYAEVAHTEFTPRRPCPGIAPVEPQARCVYGWCAAPWGGARAE
jgi:hypothetical protein